jgi:hypothetical protein
MPVSERVHVYCLGLRVRVQHAVRHDGVGRAEEHAEHPRKVVLRVRFSGAVAAPGGCWPPMRVAAVMSRFELTAMMIGAGTVGRAGSACTSRGSAGSVEGAAAGGGAVELGRGVEPEACGVDRPVEGSGARLGPAGAWDEDARGVPTCRSRSFSGAGAGGGGDGGGGDGGGGG